MISRYYTASCNQDTQPRIETIPLEYMSRTLLPFILSAILEAIRISSMNRSNIFKYTYWNALICFVKLYTS
jgi:hypothetical protein